MTYFVIDEQMEFCMDYKITTTATTTKKTQWKSK